MDEQSIFDILECSVCLERLDTSSRVLPCQHTFCMRCLQQILNTRGELRCPECRELAPHRLVTDLPTNILLVRLLDGMKRPLPPSSSSPKMVGSSTGSPGGHKANSNGAVDSSSGSWTAMPTVPGQTQPCARALYNYEAQEPTDLSFNKGAIITLLKKIDDNWYHGELDASRGFFPASYAEVLTPLPPDPPQCKALYDFDVNEQEEKDCLTFLKDDVLNVIRRVDENWIEGQKGDKIGIIPISFVELNDTAKSIVEAQGGATGGEGASSGGDASQGSGSGHEPSGSKSKSSNKRHSFTSMLGVQLRSKDSQERGSGGAGGSGSSTSPNRHSMEISSPVLLRSSNPTAANLIEAKAAAVVMATGGSSPASSPTPSTSPSPLATASGSAPSQGVTGLSRKKPAPLTLLNQPVVSGAHAPNSPTMVVAPGTPTLVSSQDPPSSPKPKVEVCVAMFNYKPQNADEIELKKGEVYTVTERCKDGWFKGMSIVSGQIGVFPGNYMQAFRPEKHKKISSSSSSATSTSSSSSTVSSRPTTSSSQSVAPSTSAPGASAGASAERKPAIMAVDGQKTVAQLQSERAAQQMHYRGPPSSAPHTGSSRPIQAPAARLSDRHPRGSPPSAGLDTAGVRQSGARAPVAGSWPGNVVPTEAGNIGRMGAGQVHAGVQTSNANPAAQTVRPRTTNPMTSPPPNAAQLAPGSPPVSGSRTQGAPFATGQAESTSVQPGVPVRQACSQMVPHQKEKKERKSRKGRQLSNEAPELSQRATSPSHQPAAPRVSASSSAAGHSPSSSKSSSPDNQPPQDAVAMETMLASSGAEAGGARGGSERVDAATASAAEPTPPKTTPLARERYHVIVPYPPTTEAELELKTGDTVLVHKKREDGWFKGTLIRTGKTGLFPGSFVEPI